jgi:murein DD-endopeptidase MepM/ murein hydrolase activator NlpD
VGAVTGPASADTDDEQRREAERRIASAERRAEELGGALEGLSAQLTDAVLALEATQARLPGAQAELSAALDELSRSQREAALIADRLAVARQQQVDIAAAIAADTVRQDELRSSIGRLARQAYKGQNITTSLGVALRTTSPDEFIAQYGAMTNAFRIQTSALGALQQIEGRSRNSQSRLAAVADAIDQLKAEADERVREADAARAAAEARKAEIEDLIAAQTAQQQTLAAMKGQAEAEVAAIEAERVATEAELAGIIARQRAAEEAARAAAAAARNSAPVALPAPSGVVTGKLFGNPTATSPMYVTSEYGMRLQPILKIYRLHAGIDLRARCETPIYAGRDGTVLSTRWLGGDGNRVMINHGFIDGNSVVTAYNHLSRFAVKPGDTVTQGQIIGYSGDTGGVSTGCHLDFQVYINGSTVNPRPYLPL